MVTLKQLIWGLPFFVGLILKDMNPFDSKVAYIIHAKNNNNENHGSGFCGYTSHLTIHVDSLTYLP